MRAVTSATAAAAIGLHRKAFDNLIARIGLQALSSGRQGLERRIPVAVLPQLALTAELSERLGMSARAAFALAESLAAGEQSIGAFVRLSVDLDRLRSAVDRAVESLIESQVRPRRGRPRRRPS